MTRSTTDLFDDDANDALDTGPFSCYRVPCCAELQYDQLIKCCSLEEQ